MAFDGAGTVAEAEADDGVEVLAEAGDEAVQGGHVVSLHAFCPSIEFVVPAAVHQFGEGGDVFGGAAEGGAAGENLLELLSLVRRGAAAMQDPAPSPSTPHIQEDVVSAAGASRATVENPCTMLQRTATRGGT